MEAKITAKGQMTLPKEVRDVLNVKPGDRIKFFVDPRGNVVILPKKPISELRGIVKSRRKRPPTIEEMDEAVRGGAAARYHRATGK